MSLFTYFVLLAAQATAAPAPPRGVNSSILGTAEEFAVRGPARVCLIHTRIYVEAGETAYLDYLGIHWGGVRVTGPHGTFLVKEGDGWAEPAGGQAIDDLHGRIVERHRREGHLRYLIYGEAEYRRNEAVPLVWVDGDAFGRSRDLSILARIQIQQNDMSSCRRRFLYGWDTILPPEQQR